MTESNPNITDIYDLLLEYGEAEREYGYLKAAFTKPRVSWEERQELEFAFERVHTTKEAIETLVSNIVHQDYTNAKQSCSNLFEAILSGVSSQNKDGESNENAE